VIGGPVEIGHRIPAVGEPDRHVCSYRVTTSVGTVLVSPGHGTPPGGTGTNAGGATVASGDTYVSIGA
jgi:hypothetical protein